MRRQAAQVAAAAEAAAHAAALEGAAVEGAAASIGGEWDEAPLFHEACELIWCGATREELAVAAASS